MTAFFYILICLFFRCFANECEKGYFGLNCTKTCNETCKSCIKTSGICDNDCKPGWKGDFCEIECEDGLFGVNCSTPCGYCFDNQTCHHVNGTCSEGCELGYRGDNCTEECSDGLFGESCGSFCGHCYEIKKCHHVTGICPKGCDPGYKGMNCKAECEDGFFGVNCSTQCGHCLRNQVCNHETGVCSEGCEAGYRGSNCNEECEDGLFGVNCSTPCGYCFNNQTCHHVNGTCSEGCELGYRGDNCTEVCDNNMYGENCNQKCGNCANSSNCNHVNGSCQSGCDLGFVGPLCTKECPNGYFGQNCGNRCNETCNSCNKTSGVCENGCKPGWKGIHCQTECPKGYFGQNCKEICNETCYSCNKTSGVCENGCKPGWKGEFCETECYDWFYGENCSSFCGHCSINKCHHVTGICPKGCESGYKGNNCKEKCAGGFFGINCSTPCGHCFKNQTCHHVSGTCLKGCEPGYIGTNCMKECDGGFFGINCSRSCGHCFRNQTCHRITGNCLEGCISGYRGNSCTEECAGGFFGINCSTPCGHCFKNQTCHHVSGTCLRGCEPGYKGTYCMKECDNGFFGINCSRSCGHCFRIQMCHRITGNCLEGCKSGYRGNSCTEDCLTGTFGRNCNETCSRNCRNSSICRTDTGHCIDGCAAGWKGDFCSEVCDKNMFGENCNQKCGNCANSSNCNHINGSCPGGCDLGFEGPLCNGECSNGQFGYNCMENCSSLCVDGICDTKSGTCKKIAFRTDSQNDHDVNVPFIGVGIGLFVIIIAAVIIVFVVKRYQRGKTKPKKIKQSNKSQCGSEMSIIRQGDGTTIEYENATSPVYDGFSSIIPEDSNYSNVNINTALNIPIDKLEIVIAEKKKNDNESFRREFAALPSGELHTCEFGKKPENVPKNRYKTTLPYDHSRVVLNIQNGENLDYINANYIEGANRQKEYIATQGPKANTRGDFWRMIWQENVTSIVMVTTLVEGEKVKCKKYWPDKDKPLIYGSVQVSLIEEKEYACFTTRQLSVFNKELKCTRVVTQYHYTAWPDHGVPEPLSLLTFHNHVINTSTNDNQGPTTVHCSAGVGRTGTYIALDALFQIGNRTGKVNVAEFVAKMRQNRVSMVQTYEQYITIHLALNEVFKAPIKVDTMVEFLNKAEKERKNIPVNQNPLHNEFQLLLKIRQNYSKDDYNFATHHSGYQISEENLPLKEYGLYLSPNKTTRNNYINAITVPSFTNLQHFIVTKYPLEENALDLLRLLSDHESDTVISMQPLCDIKSVKAWLPPLSLSSKIPPFTVHHRSKYQTDVITHEIQIVHDDAQVRTVMVVEPEVKIQCSGSSVDTSQLRSLVSTVLHLETKQPITILSSDGASLCGLFIAVHNVIQQMNMDDRVDVFTAVRQLQIRRPEFCAKYEDYETIYQAVMDHYQSASENIYYNQ